MHCRATCVSLGDWKCEFPQKDAEGYATLTNHIFIHITLQHDFQKLNIKKHSPIFLVPFQAPLYTIVICIYGFLIPDPKLTVTTQKTPPHLLRDNGDAVAAETISTTFSGAFSTTSAAFGGGAAALGADAVGGETTTAAGSAGAAGGCVDCVDCEAWGEGLGKWRLKEEGSFLGNFLRKCQNWKSIMWSMIQGIKNYILGFQKSTLIDFWENYQVLIWLLWSFAFRVVQRATWVGRWIYMERIIS